MDTQPVPGDFIAGRPEAIRVDLVGSKMGFWSSTYQRAGGFSWPCVEQPLCDF